MLDQYPDTMHYQAPGGIKTVSCRFYPPRNGDNRVYNRSDGKEVVCRFIIAFPYGTEDIPLFTIVSGHDRSGSVIVHDQELIDFHIGQLHCLGRV